MFTDLDISDFLINLCSIPANDLDIICEDTTSLFINGMFALMVTLVVAYHLWKHDLKPLAVLVLLSFVFMWLVWPFVLFLFLLIYSSSWKNSFEIYLQKNDFPDFCLEKMQYAVNRGQKYTTIKIKMPLPWRVCKGYALICESGEILFVKINKEYSVVHWDNRGRVADKWGNIYGSKLDDGKLCIEEMPQRDLFVGGTPED